MKRLFAFMMALVLVLSLGVTALAAEGTGSITITNATKDVTYSIYKIFDAAYSTNAGGEVDSIAYTIDSTNHFYAYLFGTDGTAPNDYFNYDTVTGAVSKKAGATDADVVNYLTTMVRNAGFPAEKTQTATAATLVFADMPYGYYLIDKGNGAVVTIDSNTPNVEVIDKNQKPNVDGSFDKLVYDTASGAWVDSSSASVGDIIDWKINFVATNYDGDDIVMYYSITDTKSSSLWVEFEDIEVWVDGNELKNGYYYCADDSIDTNEWEYLGEWTSGDPNDADWYLIHYTYDKFEIVIPWLDDCTFTGVQDPNQGYELKFDLNKNDGNTIYSESKFTSPSNIEVKYSAAVGPDAAGTTAQNSAYLDWTTPEGEEGPENPETTDTKVYNLGITKIANDGTATTPATRLAGAIFELYSDAACTQPVYVIPTNNEGIYILDDYNTDISGSNRVSARERYVGHWETYIGTPDSNQRNDMTTPANGQLVILGLEAGKYYLKETQAPAGYNELSAAVEVQVGPEGSNGIYTDPNYKDLNGNSIQFGVSKIDIENSKGVELPSTGGKGTMMLITFGSIVAMAFAVLMITQKKMSIYQD